MFQVEQFQINAHNPLYFLTFYSNLIMKLPIQFKISVDICKSKSNDASKLSDLFIC